MRILPVFYALIFSVFFISCGEKTREREASPEENIVESNEHEENEKGLILFYGTSLTAGLGLDQEQAYPALIHKKIDSLDLPFEVVNAGLSGETTAGGRNRIDWVLNQEVD